jgi:hypothetical protein
MTGEFFNYFMGLPFEKSAEDAALEKLAEEYYEKTEANDRKVCSGPEINGVIMPADGFERSKINSFAKKVRDEIDAKARAMGFPESRVREAFARVRQRIKHTKK